MQRGEGAVLLFVGVMLIYLSMYGLAGFPATLQSYVVYTKVDPNNLISYSVGVITQRVIRTASSYMYFDKGAGSITDFTHKVQFQVTSAVQYSLGIVWIVSNSVGDSYQLRGTTFLEAGWIATSTNDFTFFFRSWAVSSSLQPYSSQQAMGLAVGTVYYLTITGAGQTLTCSIFSDSGRSLPVTSLTINMPQDTVSFRYIYACSTESDIGSSQGSTYPGMQVVQKLDLSDSGPTPSSPPSTSPSESPSPSTSPTPYNPPDIAGWIQSILSNPTVQELMFMAGLGMVGVGGIVLVLPSKREVTVAR